MKHLLLGLVIAATAITTSETQAQNLLPPKPGTPIVITKVDEILKWLPEGVVPKKRGVPWTSPQIEIVNAALKKQIESQPYVLNMSVPVSEVATWNNQLQIFSEIPNREGYNIRLFWAFTPDWKERLARLNVGDKVTLSAPLKGAEYKSLWNSFTLVIVTGDSTLVK